MNRRAFLTWANASVGIIGAVFAAVPFFRYFLPSKRARGLGAPITIDISSFQPGDTHAFVWRGQPVLVMRRSQEQLDALALTNERLLDTSDLADSGASNIDPIHRAKRAEYLVLLGTCTHFGCVPIQEVDRGRTLMGDWWPGGFTCPCHGSVYDFAGRVVRGPAPENLRVPPYHFASRSSLVVGSDAADA